MALFGLCNQSTKKPSLHETGPLPRVFGDEGFQAFDFDAYKHSEKVPSDNQMQGSSFS